MLYAEVLKQASILQIPYALGGTLALSTHTGRWRPTKDIDIYVLPENRPHMIGLLGRLNLRDIQDDHPYDSRFLYRATNGDGIIEIIWEMQNQRTTVDPVWLARAERVQVEGLCVGITAPEEIIWTKIYVVSRTRCDWPDILNLIHYCGHAMDWKHLLNRLGEDVPLLTAALSLLTWLSPRCIYDIPSWVIDRLGIPLPAGGADSETLRWRAYLLNRQEWFWPTYSGEIFLNEQLTARARKTC